MDRRSRPLRSGFTLVELLIVIAIIGVLMSIMGVAVMNSITGARIAGTKALMTKIQRQLQSRTEAILRACRNQQAKPQLSSADVTSVDTMASLATSKNAQVRSALLTKAYMRTYLPQTWDEANFLLQRANLTAPTSNAKTESAEVLYFVLTKASIVGFTPANQDFFSGNEVRDTDGNGFPELIDAWGEPVRFYRWPTRLLRPGGYTTLSRVSDGDFLRAQTLIQGIPNSVKLTPSASSPGSFNQDPDDPITVLRPGGVWLAAGSVTDFEQGNTPFPFAFHTPFTWHTPLVVSAGTDREFGIYDSVKSNEPTHFGRLCEPYTSGFQEAFLNDNITNLNVKSGGN